MHRGERLFGIIYTTIGIALLLVVFFLAYEMLTHPVPGLASALAPTPTGSSDNAMGRVGNSVLAFLLKLAVLFVMTLAGSHVASRGIQLYHGTGLQASAAVRTPSDVERTGGATGPGSVGSFNSADSDERQ